MTNSKRSHRALAHPRPFFADVPRVSVRTSGRAGFRHSKPSSNGPPRLDPRNRKRQETPMKTIKTTTLAFARRGGPRHPFAHRSSGSRQGLTAAGTAAAITAAGSAAVQARRPLGPRPLGSPPPLRLGLRLRDRRLRRRLLPRPPLRRADQGLRVTRRPDSRRRLETQGSHRAPQAQHQAPHDRPLSRRRSTAARQGLTSPPSARAGRPFASRALRRLHKVA